MIEKEEETIHDPSSHKISLLVELRDLDIIDNHELEKLIGHYEIDYQREESNEKLSEYVSLLKEIRQDQVINLENYDSRVVELQVKLKNKV